MNDVTLDYHDNGSYSVTLYLDQIAHILSGVCPYILIDQYDKRIKTIDNLTIHHKARTGESFHQFPNIEAHVLSVHQIRSVCSYLAIVTLVIDKPPNDFFDFVMERSDQLSRSSDPVLRTSERSFFSFFRP